MANILIRGVPDEVREALVQSANANRRSMEKEALVLLETGLRAGEMQTCGELCDAIWAAPAPQVEESAIEAYLAERGRRSPRL